MDGEMKIGYGNSEMEGKPDYVRDATHAHTWDNWETDLEVEVKKGQRPWLWLKVRNENILDIWSVEVDKNVTLPMIEEAKTDQVQIMDGGCYKCQVTYYTMC
eukprot:Clim_evm2s58 gene=Clim_evmTU2s58